MGKVPHAGAPVLQIDVPQLGARADDEFDRAAVQPGWMLSRSAAGGFGQQRGFGPFVQNDEHVAEIDAPGERAVNMCNGSSIPRPWAHTEPIRPTNKRHAVPRIYRPVN